MRGIGRKSTGETFTSNVRRNRDAECRERRTAAGSRGTLRSGLPRRSVGILSLLFVMTCVVFPFEARGQSADDGKLPYRQPPVDYFGAETDDAVAKLESRLEQGEVSLEFKQEQGYLRAVLDALEVPVASQMLVFAKNSVNARIISPENPRALYFNDEVYVGWVPGAPALEISAVDPRKGAIFYTLKQQADAPPRFVREEGCLLCHASSHALNVPGHLVRSFLTDPQGNPTQGSARVTHDTPLAQRWGGWYVTGDFGRLAHQGNLATAVDLQEYQRDPGGPGRTAELPKRCRISRYPSAHSDVVALLVHDHQVHFHNLLTRAGFEERFERREVAERSPEDKGAAEALSKTEEQLVRYLLFADAAPLENPVLGSSPYEAWFAKHGPRDRQGRSLREFELETRLFRYRCSYLIYSRAFDALPVPVKARVYRRLREVLQSDLPPEAYHHLDRDERQAIAEILRETKRDLAEAWKVPDG